MNERIGEFADLVIQTDCLRALSYVQALLAQGASVEALFQDLIGPTARRLGELWSEDINSIMDVTQGLGHLQSLVRTFAPDFRQDTRELPGLRRALLVARPGEQHTLGIFLIEEYFRRAGWSVWGGPMASMDELVTLVSANTFDMIGLSTSHVREPEALAFDIRVLRSAARNRNLAVMVGGLPFVRQPELAYQIGADATAIDGNTAVTEIGAMLGGGRKQI